jgi:hypothetical protein
MSLFACSVDQCSETEIVEEVHQLNYLVVNLIVNLLDADTSFTPRNCTRNHSNSENVPDLLTLLNNRQISDGDAKVFVIEFLLRSLIFTILHAHYFDGRTFFGIGSDHFRAKLERMIDELRAGGMFIYIYILFYFIFLFLFYKNINSTYIYY